MIWRPDSEVVRSALPAIENGETIDVTDWVILDPEQMGKKAKVWVQPDLASSEKYLFKEVRSVKGALRGEDWAEYVAAAVAKQVGVRTPVTWFAIRERENEYGPYTARGILSENFVPPDSSLVHGSELLSAQGDYDSGATGQNAGYTLSAVKDALTGVAGWHTDTDGYQSWLQILILDDLIVNTDRHHDNWGVLRGQLGDQRLAPAYDHGSSLGFQVPEAEMLRRLASDEHLAAFLSRGRSRPFAGKPRLHDLARDAAGGLSEASCRLLDLRLRSVDWDVVESTIQRVPPTRMSNTARFFAMEVLRSNQRRLLDVVSC